MFPIMSSQVPQPTPLNVDQPVYPGPLRSPISSAVREHSNGDATGTRTKSCDGESGKHVLNYWPVTSVVAVAQPDPQRDPGRNTPLIGLGWKGVAMSSNDSPFPKHEDLFKRPRELSLNQKSLAEGERRYRCAWQQKAQ